LLHGHTNAISQIIQLENDDLVSSSIDKTILVWDWNTKKIKLNLTGHSNFIRGLKQLHNGYLVTAGYDSRVIIWK
jgi:WD40 repeat protein